MTPKGNPKNYEIHTMTITVTVPRQRTTGMQTTWQSSYRNRNDNDDGDVDVDLEDAQRHLPQQRVYPKHLFGGSRKKQQRTTYSSLGGYSYGLWLLLASNHKTRTRNIIAFFFSCYAFAFLLFAPSLLQGKGLASSIHNSNNSNNNNMVLTFLRNSIRGRRWNNEFDDGDDDDDDDGGLFLEVDDENDNDEYFSACILWMDDNHRLEEWLAYHYYLLKLRYVVINVDPKSTTSPQAIVDRWNGKNKKFLLEYDLNMTIVLWNDTQYIDPVRYAFKQAKISSAKGDEKYQLATEYHKYRQPEFYKACSRHLISEREKQYQEKLKSTTSNNSSSNTFYNNYASQWTTYHDTDEFLAFESESYTDWHVAGASTRQWHKYETPGYVLKRLNAIKKEGIRVKEKERRQLEKKNQQQQFADQDSNSSSNNDTSTLGARTTTTPPLSGISCLVVPRHNFCSIELFEDETDQLLLDAPPPSRKNEVPSTSDVFVPSEFVREKWLLETTKLKKQIQPSGGGKMETTSTSKEINGTTIVRRFDTLRYQYQTPGLGNYGKSIVDLSQTDVRDIAKKKDVPWQTHGVISSICDIEEGTRSSSLHRSKKIQQLVENEKMVRTVILFIGGFISFIYSFARSFFPGSDLCLPCV